MDTRKECIICHDCLDESAESLACFHVYHKVCIDAWFKTQTESKQDNTCPVCRHVVKYFESGPSPPEAKIEFKRRMPAHAVPFFLPSRDTLVSIGLTAVTGALLHLGAHHLRQTLRSDTRRTNTIAYVSESESELFRESSMTVHPELPFDYQKKPFDFRVDF